MEFLRKYNTATHIYIPIVKRAVVDFAVGADWTPAAGDVKISKDGGAAANVTNLPTAIAMGNTAYWDFSLTATELQAAKVVVTVADSATKAVEDQSFLIATYGNASAEHAIDLDDSVRAGLTALPNAAAEAAGGLYTRGSGAGQINQNANGQIDTRTVTMANAVIAAATFAAGAIDAAAIAADAIGASELAADAVAEIVNAVWDETTAEARVAGTYGQKLKDLLVDGSGRVTVGGFAAGAITAAAFALDAIDAAALKGDACNEIADALLDRAAAAESFTVRQLLRGFASALLAKASGLAGTTAHYRDIADTKDRILATVDQDGNRTAVTLDLT